MHSGRKKGKHSSELLFTHCVTHGGRLSESEVPSLEKLLISVQVSEHRRRNVIENRRALCFVYCTSEPHI